MELYLYSLHMPSRRRHKTLLLRLWDNASGSCPQRRHTGLSHLPIYYYVFHLHAFPSRLQVKTLFAIFFFRLLSRRPALLIFWCVRKIGNRDYQLHGLSVRPHETTWLPLDGFQLNSIRVFFDILSRKFKFHYNLIRTSTLYKDLLTFMIISHSVLIRMKNISDKLRRKS